VNYYPFHIGDFRSGTSNMSRQSRWIYRDMMDIYYDTELPLVLDLDVLCDKLGVEVEEERRIVERLLKFKFTKTDTGYLHHICETVIATYHTKAEIAAENGKRGGRPRKEKGEPAKPKNNQKKPSGLTVGSDPVNAGLANETHWLANQTQDLADRTQSKANESGLKANQEPRTNNQEPVNPVTTSTLSQERIRSQATPAELNIAFRKRGVNTHPDDPRLSALSEQGLSTGTADAACDEARKTLGPDAVIALGYIVGILVRWVNEGRMLNVAGAAPPARAAPGGYESTRDRERRETLEGLTGSGKESDDELTANNPLA
jgi:uncharacterized protein YdaU (DUF1376 family)